MRRVVGTENTECVYIEITTDFALQVSFVAC